MSILAESPVTVIPAGTWSIDPSWSALEFEVRKLGLVTVKGRVPSFSGTITGGDNAAIEGVVDATSITTFESDRDAHLQSPDFFDIQRYPELRFVSTSVDASSDEIVVRGDLTIKGVTKPVELRGTLSGPENDPWGNERIGLELSTTVDRTAFGLEWNAPLPGGGFLLPNDVALKAYFAATRTV
ncbi:MAG TPA: YceI family protein [Gaiellaceae bacterium]|nr:YceI family protein [Gaiellaceae bacterium]